MVKLERKRQSKVILICILIMLILDEGTKYIFYKNGQIINPNEIEKGNNSYYILMSIIVVLMSIKYISNDNTFIKMGTKVVLSIGIAGAIGNIIDRIFYGYVVVFIKLANSFNINLAYIYIFIAWIGMAVILTKNSYKFLKDKKGKLDGYKSK